jgi:hypothetical protein
MDETCADGRTTGHAVTSASGVAAAVGAGVGTAAVAFVGSADENTTDVAVKSGVVLFHEPVRTA